MHALDQSQLRRLSDSVASRFDELDFFCAEIRSRLLERLQLITLQPECILELGSGTGNGAQALRQTYPDARVLQLDWSQAMLRHSTLQEPRICADAHALPLSDASIDMVFSNLMLPGCADPEQIFHSARRVLKHPGLFLFTTLGPDSFKELRKAWAAVDPAPHVHSFADMHNVGDALVQAGFREPVMDVEHLTITYADVSRLIEDLRAVGAINLLSGRRRGLTTPRLWQRMLAELDARRNADGRLTVSLEVITGQAWTGEPAAGVRMHEGEAHFPLDQLGPRGGRG